MHDGKFVANKTLRETVVTASGSFIVPDGVFEIEYEYVGPGGGGGGGHASGGAGGGGGPGGHWKNQKLPVTAGQTITETVGLKGTGGAIGASGTASGTPNTLISGGNRVLPAALGGNQGLVGGAANGGNGSAQPLFAYGTPVGATGGAAAGPAGGAVIAFGDWESGTGGGAGAGTGAGTGGLSRSLIGTAVSVLGGTAIGGGAGGCTRFGNGGVGGTTAAPGVSAAAGAYGAGGGGGGQNAAGGDGMDGVIIRRWWQ